MLSASRRVFAAVTRQSVLASKTTTKHINLRAVSRPPFQVAHFATTSSSSDRNQPASTQKGKVQADPRIVNFAAATTPDILKRAKDDPKHKHNLASKLVAIAEGWTLIFWMGAIGVVIYEATDGFSTYQLHRVDLHLSKSAGTWPVLLLENCRVR